MNDVELKRLLEAAWRRPLSLEEQAQLQAWLAQHPQAQHAWEEEAALTHLLHHLPPLPVPPHFARRVLRAVEAEAAAAKRVPWLGWLGSAWSSGWAPRLAYAGVVLALLAGGGLHLQRQHQQRQALLEDIKMVGTLAILPHPETLTDFEPIQQFSTVPPVAWVDTELLAALQ